MSMAEIDKLKKRIRELIDLYKERRSDVVENLECLLLDEEFTQPERRYITTTVPKGASTVEYDTYTTLHSFELEDGEWTDLNEEINTKYTD